MAGKMARLEPRPSVRITRGAGSGRHLASVLQEGRQNAKIDAGLGFHLEKSRFQQDDPRGRKKYTVLGELQS
jgi:hypothetical protein